VWSEKGKQPKFPRVFADNAGCVRSHVASTYRETVTLPPGVTLSVIVQ
jgi:hypothetical protein